MRITKKEMPYLRTPKSKNMSNYSMFSNIDSDSKKFDDIAVVAATAGAANKRQPYNTATTNSVHHRTLHAMNKNMMLTSKTASTIADSKRKFNQSSKTKPYQSYSTEFPNGLPFEDEFYRNHIKRDKSNASSKSELSDYGSIENDSDHSYSHLLLPFEEEFACRRPSIEALYVDFSKPIATNRTTIKCTYSKSSVNEFSSSNCSSNSSSNVAINTAHNYDLSSPNYVNSPDEVIVSNQPVVYVAVQWRSNQNGLNDRKPHRFDAV